MIWFSIFPRSSAPVIFLSHSGWLFILSFHFFLFPVHGLGHVFFFISIFIHFRSWGVLSEILSLDFCSHLPAPWRCIQKPLRPPISPAISAVSIFFSLLLCSFAGWYHLFVSAAVLDLTTALYYHYTILLGLLYILCMQSTHRHSMAVYMVTFWAYIHYPIYVFYAGQTSKDGIRPLIIGKLGDHHHPASPRPLGFLISRWARWLYQMSKESEHKWRNSISISR